MTAKLTWLVRRLRVMSLAEIVSRVADQIVLFRLQWSHRKPPEPLPSEPPATGRNPEFVVGEIRLDVDAIAADLAALLEGQLHYGGGDWHFDDEASSWHREHTTLRDWPQKFFNAVDYRPGNPVGDVRRSWEPARLQQLIGLAVRPRDLGIEQGGATAELAIDMIERQLVSWWRHNPYLHGIHYVSAMECGLRCIAISHAAALLESRGRLSPRVRAIVLAILEQHAGFIRRRISTHSSAGNHTLAETAGLIYACLMLPDRQQSRRDEHFATALFASEFDRQVRADGGGLEQATWYHRFNIELGECVSATLVANERRVPQRISDALERGGRFLRQLTDSASGFARIGDADDGYALSPYYIGRWKLQPPGDRVQHFGQSGLSRIRHYGWDVLVLHGALGMPPSFGHGHADALSVLVSLDNVELLCDSGTGAYAGENADLRSHFRSCAAHNTVQVGDGDFSRALSPFMWSHPYHCELVRSSQSEERIELWMRLSVDVTTPFVVERYFCVARDAMTFIDQIHADEHGYAAQRWHFPVEIDPVESDGLPSESMRFRANAGAGVLVEFGPSGSVEKMAGQRSPRYGEVEPVTVISNAADLSRSTRLCMRLRRLDVDTAATTREPVASFERASRRAQEYFA